MQQTHKLTDKTQLSTIKSEVLEEDQENFKGYALYNKAPLVKEVLIDSGQSSSNQPRLKTENLVTVCKDETTTEDQFQMEQTFDTNKEISGVDQGSVGQSPSSKPLKSLNGNESKNKFKKSLALDTTLS